MTLAPPPDFFDDDFKTVMKLIIKMLMTSFQLHKDRHQKSPVAAPASPLLDATRPHHLVDTVGAR